MPKKMEIPIDELVDFDQLEEYLLNGLITSKKQFWVMAGFPVKSRHIRMLIRASLFPEYREIFDSLPHRPPRITIDKIVDIREVERLLLSKQVKSKYQFWQHLGIKSSHRWRRELVISSLSKEARDVFDSIKDYGGRK